MRIALRALDVEEAFRPGAARLVDDDDRLLHQVVLGDDPLEEARHLVGAASGAGGHDEQERNAEPDQRRTGIGEQQLASDQHRDAANEAAKDRGGIALAVLVQPECERDAGRDGQRIDRETEEKPEHVETGKQAENEEDGHSASFHDE